MVYFNERNLNNVWERLGKIGRIFKNWQKWPIYCEMTLESNHTIWISTNMEISHIKNIDFINFPRLTPSPIAKPTCSPNQPHRVYWIRNDQMHFDKYVATHTHPSWSSSPAAHKHISATTSPHTYAITPVNWASNNNLTKHVFQMHKIGKTYAAECFYIHTHTPFFSHQCTRAFSNANNELCVVVVCIDISRCAFCMHRYRPIYHQPQISVCFSANWVIGSLAFATFNQPREINRQLIGLIL